MGGGRPARQDPIERLFAALVRNAMEDLGCTGRLGGIPDLGPEDPRTQLRRAGVALNFIESEDFEAVCLAAGFDAERWRTNCSRQIRVVRALVRGEP